MTRKVSMRWLGLAVLLTPVTGIAQPVDPIDELKGCARITELELRVPCYEALGHRLLEQERIGPQSEIVRRPLPTHGSIAENSRQPETTTETATAIPDDLGGTGFKSTGNEEPLQYTGLITSCRQNLNKVWIFYFENGQVWAQADSGRLKIQNCHFPATITQDLFGYKMAIDGTSKKIRVSRIK